MDNQDIRTLKILEEIEQDQTPSQRVIALKLNISLGLANSFIKRLASKGYFKVTNIPKNRVKYILTPKGAAEKTRLTYEYVKYSFEFYNASRQKLRRLFQDLVEQGVARIIFYGVSDLAEIAYVSLQEFPIKFVGIVDETKKDQDFFGYIVSDFFLFETDSYDKVLLTLVAPAEEVLKSFPKEWLGHDKIVVF